MKPEIKRLAEARLSKSREAFREASILFEQNAFLGAVSRFYYAAFYAVRALLITQGLDSSKHSGIISLFHEHFVKTAQFDREKAKALSRAFEMRQDSDYEDFVKLSREEVLAMKREIEAFVHECEKVLRGIS